MIKHAVNETISGKLSTSLTDEFSDYTEHTLSQTKLNHKDILRFRLSVDTAMCTWLEVIGEGAECVMECKRRFGRTTIDITCEGKKCNPQQQSEEFGNIENSSILQSLGLSTAYSYENGVNRFRLMPGSGFVIQLLPMLISLMTGIVSGLVLKAAAPAFATALNTQVVSPLFSALMNILRAIAGPLIFLSILSGIYSIGDIVSLGSIVKKIMSRFLIMTFVTLGVTLAILLSTMPISIGQYSAGSSSISELLNIVLQFFPTDIVSPFISGNMIQIITLAVAFGMIMLILGNRVSEITKVTDQIYSAVQLLMEEISHFIPLFIFISMFSFILSDTVLELKYLLYPAIGVIGSFVVIGLGLYPLILKLKYGVSFRVLIRKLLPTFIIAFTTASSAAALSSNIETCEKSLGISNNITKFGIPLGQVVYMPCVAAEYISISMVMANIWNIDISLTWIISAVLIAGILAIATPPVPVGPLSVFTVLFLQLNIPESALPIALGIAMFLDYIVTAGNIMCLQEEIIICADKAGLLDKEILLSEKQKTV